MTYTPRHAREPRIPTAALSDPLVAAGVADPADLPLDPTGELPTFVAVPPQARQVMDAAGIDLAGFDHALAIARAEERLAVALERCHTAAERLIEALRERPKP